jgi:hypothetical protein
VIARNLGSTYMLLPAPLMRLRVLLAARLPPGSPALQVCVCVFVCVCVCVCVRTASIIGLMLVMRLLRRATTRMWV